MFGTKCPSITSTWMIVPPPSAARETCSPSRAKSADNIEGASSINRDSQERGCSRNSTTCPYWEDCLRLQVHPLQQRLIPRVPVQKIKLRTPEVNPYSCRVVTRDVLQPAHGFLFVAQPRSGKSSLRIARSFRRCFRQRPEKSLAAGLPGDLSNHA